ncbi:hypothetical protein [Hymenobacter terricola]|uniref:hypothetical protein n=1 Tax=Hymenobacter terricola TaxID=2819236 RepID=UPI001B30F3E0|nr:hypothetical protein [Hymenobacter terricola]
MENLLIRTLSAFLDVSYRSLDQTIVFRWVCPFLSEAEFRVSYQALLDTAVQHNCAHWLLDLRRRFVNSREQDHWVLHEFYPQVEAAFPTAGLVYAAYLVSPAALAQYANVLLPALNNNSDACCRAAAFIDEGPANSWLTKQRFTKGALVEN